ncbi:MAG: hypothetical protein B7Z55_01205 [Planctomycetales bacterium 12-60-4]|nr:MAG: hypothetical protein B7Z55_01205 [Planctomycetales bacterium 12-60-4]
MAIDGSGCQHLEPIVEVIQQSIAPLDCQDFGQLSATEKEAFMTAVARANVSGVAEMLLGQSQMLSNLHQVGRVAIIGAIYDIVTGDLDFIPYVDA